MSRFPLLFVIAALAASATAFAAPATEHTTSIDLFEADPSLGKPDWEAARKGSWTKPYIPWILDARQGDGVVDFGDVRFHDEVVTHHKWVDVLMAIRISGVDDYDWTYWDEQVNLRLASRPKDPSHISSDPSTRVWEDQPGFYLWGHDITDLKVVGLPYSSKTTIEVVWLAVNGDHDSMAPHRLTHCVGTELDVRAFTRFNCGGTDLKLAVIGRLMIWPFPLAPEVAPPTIP